VLLVRHNNIISTASHNVRVKRFPNIFSKLSGRVKRNELGERRKRTPIATKANLFDKHLNTGAYPTARGGQVRSAVIDWT
jgi:hypothetical protein